MLELNRMMKVLDLQTLSVDIIGGQGVRDWSTESNQCGTVQNNEWSTTSNGCPKETALRF